MEEKRDNPKTRVDALALCVTWPYEPMSQLKLAALIGRRVDLDLTFPFRTSSVVFCTNSTDVPTFFIPVTWDELGCRYSGDSTPLC